MQPTEPSRSVGAADPDMTSVGVTPPDDPAVTATHVPGLASPTPASDVAVPGYEIEGVLGHGGMGVVYKALHRALKRTVALKMVRAGGLAGPHHLARFRVEAEAVARLQHPNIVQIHEVGEAGGLPYFALEYVEGGTLAGRLATRSMTPREAAAIVESLARAMQLAHSRNVVHRDLKPANILLTIDGTPKIGDFGLARQLDSDSGETMSGAVMGTPSYMAPEQASGMAHEAGPVADVHALGAILYDCLAGRPPYLGKNVAETLELVRTQEALPPSRWRDGVPIDLDTICLKCLRKEPENRYASAAELADELSRFRSGKPILARPVSRLERLGMWGRRNPWEAGTLAGLVAIVLAAFGLITWSSIRAETARKEESKQRIAADDARDDARREQQAERWGRYRSDIAAASSALQAQNGGAAFRALDDAPAEHRNWEWNYLRNQLDGASLVLKPPGGSLRSMSLSPSGRQVAVCGVGEEDVYLYDIVTGKRDAVLAGVGGSPVAFAAFRPDGLRIATVAEDQTLREWDASTAKPVGTSIPGAPDPGELGSVLLKYTPDGQRVTSIASRDMHSRRTRLWDPAAGTALPIPGVVAGETPPTALSPDGKRIAIGVGGSLHLCDTSTGKTIAVLGPHARHLYTVEFSPDGKRLATTDAGDDFSIHLWDGESGKKLGELKGHGKHVNLLRFTPDGSRLLSCADYKESMARAWNVADGAPLAKFEGHTNTIQAMAVSPDGTRFVTASSDQTARLWDVRGEKPPIELVGHKGIVRHVLFNPAGTRILTGSDDLTLRLWDARTGAVVAVLRGHTDFLDFPLPPRFTPDGSRLVTGSLDGTVRVWDMSLVERNGILNGHGDFVYDVAFSPDGDRLASGSWDGTARLWDATSGTSTDVLPHPGKGVITSVAFAGDGRSLVTVDRYRGLTRWELAGGKALRSLTFPLLETRECRAGVSPDGTWVAYGTLEGPVRMWFSARGAPYRSLEGHTDTSIDMVFRPDGRQLATTSFDKTVRLWDVASGAPTAVLRGHAGYVWRAAYTADGRLLASGSSDGTVRLWDAESHQPVDEIKIGSIVYGVAFSPDGTRLAAACSDNTVRIIDVARRQQVAELIGHTQYVHAVSWSRDGTRLASASGDWTVRVWDALPPRDRATTPRH